MEELDVLFFSSWLSRRMFTPRKNNSCRPYSFPKPICLICQNCWSIDFLEMFKLSSSFPFNFNCRFKYAPFTLYIHPGKLPWQWKTNHLKMYLLLKVVIFRPVILCSEAKRRSPLEPSGRYQPYSPRHGSNLLRPKIFQFLFAISWGVGPLDSHEFEKYLFTLSNHL